ncbi:small secreted protein [Whalleya microplaca]|nr:small secreted protein [Whalleya microplaca]
MHSTTFAAAILSFAAITTQTCLKADEYASADCNYITYAHSCFVTRDITMDDKTHSVYLATQDDDEQKWQGYTGKTKNGGACTGDFLGDMPVRGCNPLDYTFKKDGAWTRVRCVRRCNKKADRKTSDGYWVCR